MSWLAAAYFVPGKSSSVADDSVSEVDDSDSRQSLLARLARAVWLSLAAAACFAIGQLAAVDAAVSIPGPVYGRQV
jgi:hypothetical protein